MIEFSMLFWILLVSINLATINTLKRQDSSVFKLVVFRFMRRAKCNGGDDALWPWADIQTRSKWVFLLIKSSVPETRRISLIQCWRANTTLSSSWRSPKNEMCTKHLQDKIVKSLCLWNLTVTLKTQLYALLL